MENKEKFKTIIEGSDLPEEDKKEWLSFADLATEEYIASALEILSRYPEELPWLNSILKKKKEALAIYKLNRNKAQIMLSKIYEEERLKLEFLLGQL